MFELALLNPLRFIDTNDINFSFDGNFATEQVLSYQNPRCYFQKWQHSDVLKLQLLSDSEPSDIAIKDIATDLQVRSLEWQLQETNIVDHDFKVYEITMPFNQLVSGKYYAEQTFIDDDDVEHTLISEPFCVSALQENTTLLKYRNSENDFDVIFDTNIEFQFRVESAVKNYMPGTNRVVFTDQMVNPTSVSAMPYRKFKYFIGYGQGVPDWVFDKVTHILAVDQVRYNGISYQVTEGAEYEADRNDDNNYIGGSIDVQPTDNNFSRYQTADRDETNSFIPMQKILRYYNQGADLIISGIFKKYTQLEKICISKRSANFTLTVGTTNGGNDICTADVDQEEYTMTIERLFNSPATLYLNGLAGADVDIMIVYKQLDEPPITLLPSTTTPEGICSAKLYVELVDGDLERDWNISTGLGSTNSNWKGWAWMDGRNGTPDWKGRTPEMTDSIDSLGQLIGSDTVTLTRGQLPAEGLEMFASNIGNIGGNTPGPNDSVARARNFNNQTFNYEMVKGIGSASLGRTANMGRSEAINIKPSRVKALWVMKISD